MLYDGISLVEGSSISNASVETGTSFPLIANAGELFFRATDSTLYVYSGTAWVSAGAADAATLLGTTLATNVVSSSLTSVGTLGSLTVTGNVVAADPTSSVHLTTKSYVDSLVQGLSWKNAVRATTTANITLSGTQTVDGVALVAGDRVLAKNQTTATQNGVYVVAAGAWTRAADMDGSPDVGEVNGAAVYTTDGTVNSDTTWTQTATISAVGTQAMTFAQLGGNSVNASTLTGTTLAASVTGSSLTSVGTLGSLAVSGTHTQTGALNLAGASSPLQVGASAGTSGQVLTSAGAGATPTWTTPTTAVTTLTATASLVPSATIGTTGVYAGTPSGLPSLWLSNSGAAANTKLMVIDQTTTGQVSFKFANDALNTSSTWFTAFRTPSSNTAATIELACTNLSLAISQLFLKNAANTGTTAGVAGEVLTSRGTSASPTWLTPTAAAGTLTGTTLASNVTASSLNSVGTLTSLSVSGATSCFGGLTINSNSLTFSSNALFVINGSAGNSGQVLTSGGLSSSPSWQNASSGGASLTASNTWTSNQTFSYMGATIFSSSGNTGSGSIKLGSSMSMDNAQLYLDGSYSGTGSSGIAIGTMSAMGMSSGTNAALRIGYLSMTLSGMSDAYVGYSSGSVMDCGMSGSLVLSSSYSGGVYIRASNAKKISIDSTSTTIWGNTKIESSLTPVMDGMASLGSMSYRWGSIYASSSVINTSDANLKEQVLTLSAAELQVATAIKGLIRRFKFKDAVAAKGAAARIHVGVIAQDVQAAFTAAGLNANDYGLFCEDTWYTLNGETVPAETAGATLVTRLGIRYEELLAFVIAAL
jgi:hypothetical protein